MILSTLFHPVIHREEKQVKRNEGLSRKPQSRKENINFEFNLENIFVNSWKLFICFLV
jgi:hypothetical protein